MAIFYGNQKPNPVDEYLNELLSELKDLMQNGLYAIEKQYSVSVFAFVYDAPARSFLKCIKGHTAYYSCERCVARGTWNGRVVFNSEFDAAPRTDERFQNFDYDIHQIKKSPLIDIGLPCVTMFSLDYMHLVCLGVTKRILTFLKQAYVYAYVGYAKDLLLYFVKNVRMVYGETFSSYNVHAVCHLADDVNNFGTTLNEIS